MKLLIFSLLILMTASMYSCSSSGGSTSNAALENTRWVLRSLNNVKVSEGKKEAFITFKTGENKFNGSGGCNNMFGNYSKISNNLTIGPVARTEMFCEGLMDVENNFVKALERNAKYKIKGDRLDLIDSTNKVTASLEAVYTK